MRSTCWLAFAFVLSACGDSGNGPIDAPSGDTLLGTKCSDGIDNDGDGKIDYPADPGCVLPQADDESDSCPDGAMCPQCGNGRDDDGNGLTDYPADPGCASAGDATELVENPVACGATMMIKNLPPTGMDMGTLATTSTSLIASTCGGGNGAAAIAYRIEIAQPTVIVATTSGSMFDTVLDLRGADCDDPSSELACHDDISAKNETSRITKSLLAGTYFLIVEGANTAELGMYSISVERFAGEGVACTDTSQCGPTLVCRTPFGAASMICTKPQCGDTLDDDGDTKNGYPTDPGCMSPDDNDETDPNPLPACANGLDDDDDDDIDYPADTSCMSASGTSEACSSEIDPVAAITTGTTNGTLVGAHDDHDATCDDDFDGSGVDILYTLEVPALQSLTIDTSGSTADTVLSLLNSTCAEPSLGCDDESGATSGSSLLTLNNLVAGSYVIAVDNYSADTAFFPNGPFTLHVAGVIANGESCESPLAVAGALQCDIGHLCAGTAGARTCQVAICSDGLDNDTDTKFDYPFDPGCSSPTDMDETNPGTAPVCSNAVDDEPDGLMDYPADYGCSSAAGTSEVFCATETNPTSVITTTPVTGTTTGATNDYSTQSCAFLGNSAGPDIALALHLPVAVSSLTLDLLNSNFDTEISLRDTTCTTELGCNEDDDVSFELQSVLRMGSLAAGNYAVIIDGYNGTSGTYSLAVHGIVTPGALCSSPLFAAGVLACPTTTTCTGTPLRCQ